jgi:hypothetical protein
MNHRIHETEIAPTDFNELMRILSRPRPNGSEALQDTRDALSDWLAARAIPCRWHSYKARPYFMEAIGISLLISQTLLVLAIWFRLGWPALLIAILGLLVTQLEAKGFPLLSRFGAGQSENIIIEFAPPQPKQELVLSAHYDSKTELMDHRLRAVFMKWLPIAAVLSLIMGLLGLLDAFLSPSSDIAYFLGLGLSIPHLIIVTGLGANFTFGRLSQPQSQGAVDNGAACAIILDLARLLTNGMLTLQHTRLTIALFTGEEVAAQGSTAYVADREWPLPTISLNLEFCGQNGSYIVWNKYGGGSVAHYPASAILNDQIVAAVTHFNQRIELLQGPVGTDSVPFVIKGIPATTLGMTDRELGIEGFHRPADNLGRVVMERLPETRDIVAHILVEYDSGRLADAVGQNGRADGWA